MHERAQDPFLWLIGDATPDDGVVGRFRLHEGDELKNEFPPPTHGLVHDMVKGLSSWIHNHLPHGGTK